MKSFITVSNKVVTISYTVVTLQLLLFLSYLGITNGVGDEMGGGGQGALRLVETFWLVGNFVSELFQLKVVNKNVCCLNSVGFNKIN